MTTEKLHWSVHHEGYYHASAEGFTFHVGEWHKGEWLLKCWRKGVMGSTWFTCQRKEEAFLMAECIARDEGEGVQ